MTSRTLASRSFAFDAPRWKPASRLASYTTTALLALLVWGALFVWLGWRLWQALSPVYESFNLMLTGALIVSGVVVVLVWWQVVHRWQLQMRAASWRALSLEEMLGLSPSQFEDYIGQRLFARQGYKVENTPDVADGGVDVILTDAQGRVAVVQCKRYRGTVGEEIVRDLYGTMIHSGANRAFLVTTGTISAAANRWATGKPIELIDGARLVQLAHALSNAAPAAASSSTLSQYQLTKDR